MKSHQGGFVKITSILLTALAAGTLAAQDAPALDSRFQAFVELTFPSEIVVANAGGEVKDHPKQQTGIGFRYLGQIAGTDSWYYELGGMFDASSTFKFSGTMPDGVTTLDLSNAKLTDSYWSLGAGYLFKAGETGTLGVHLEGRGEYLRLQGQVAGSNFATPQGLDKSTTYLRPWLRVSGDVTFQNSKSVRPFLGLEGSFALLKTGQTRLPDFTSIDDRTVRSLAPRYSGAVYAGLRF
jgi:hypothetical protein